ncbi:MAG: MetS family NSS transporter small subunit [Candidatus Aminicenantes bacterium]|nr:MetS family NSS transporter small subunit [Candidatus Aminicenantes bacterium]
MSTEALIFMLLIFLICFGGFALSLYLHSRES